MHAVFPTLERVNSTVTQNDNIAGTNWTKQVSLEVTGGLWVNLCEVKTSCLGLSTPSLSSRSSLPSPLFHLYFYDSSSTPFHCYRLTFSLTSASEKNCHRSHGAHCRHFTASQVSYIRQWHLLKGFGQNIKSASQMWPPPDLHRGPSLYFYSQIFLRKWHTYLNAMPFIRSFRSQYVLF